MDFKILIIFLGGLIIGSFLNVCIFRIIEEESIVFPASHCKICNTKLKAKDLIPIFSFLFLKGKCRYCKEKISAQYPLIELFTAILFVIMYLKFGVSLEFFKFVTFTAILLVIGIIDYKTQYIYFEVIVTGLIFGIIFLVIAFFLEGNLELKNILLSTIIPSSFLALIILMTNGMGWGDVELVFIIGVFLELKLNLLSLFISVILAGLYAIYLLLFKKKDRRQSIAFAPYIAVSAFITILFGNQILNWYFNYLIY